MPRLTTSEATGVAMALKVVSERQMGGRKLGVRAKMIYLGGQSEKGNSGSLHDCGLSVGES
jgi:hypothetical protein